MILYHGTTELSGKRILKHGFNTEAKPKWKVKSKKGFVYLSLAYAPFYAMVNNKGKNGAIVKVEVNKDNLYPDDDFVMLGLGKPVYTQEELDKVHLEDFKHLALKSLEYLGNACAKVENIKVLGARTFSLEGIGMVCDPSITPLNFKFMGDYYKKLTESIYETGSIDAFQEQVKKKNLELFNKIKKGVKWHIK